MVTLSRMVEENVYAGDQICEIVSGLTADEGVRLHATVAGGRKTMGIHLTAAPPSLALG